MAKTPAQQPRALHASHMTSKMSKYFLALLMLAAMVGTAFGQADHSYSLYGHLFGPTTGVGIGIDSRFKAGGILGYSVGIAFTDISWSDDDGLDGCYSSFDVDSKGISIPLEFNAIMGRRASKFELGIGMTTYLVHRKELRINSQLIFDTEGQIVDIRRDNILKNVFRPNIVGILNIGYRLQRKSGFFMKLGLTLLVGDLKCSPIDGIVALPNICFGYTIPHF